MKPCSETIVKSLIWTLKLVIFDGNFFFHSLKITFLFRSFVRFEHFFQHKHVHFDIFKHFWLKSWFSILCEFLNVSIPQNVSIQKNDNGGLKFKYLKNTCFIQLSIYIYSWIFFTALHLNSWLKQFNTCYQTDFNIRILLSHQCFGMWTRKVYILYLDSAHENAWAEPQFYRFRSRRTC